MLLIALSLPGLAWSASVPQQRKEFTKITVAFDQPTFDVSYGQTITLCATVTPSRLKSKVVFTSNPIGVLEITPGTVEGCAGVSLTVKSSVQKCSAQGSVVAKVNSKTVKSAAGTVKIPTGDYANLVASGSCLPVGCFYKDYNVFMTGPTGMNLTGVSAAETVTNRRQVDTRPLCPFDLQQTIEAIPLEQGGNGLFGVGDHLQIPGGSISGACADRYDQIVKVGACTVQTNVLTFEADNYGTRNITRSDEQ